MINIYNKQKDLSISTFRAKQILALLMEDLQIYTDELTVYFVTNARMCKVHLDFFSDPSPTDSISFPMDPPKSKKDSDDYRVLGELFVCPKTALDYAKKNGTDPYDETLLYMIHGFLHLIGYDDLETGPRRKMRLMERRCMEKVRKISLRP